MTGLLAAGVSLAARQPPGTITDEAKVPPYTLPDPLVLADGTRVRDAEAWRTRRRPELLRLFESEIYGRTPGPAPAVRAVDVRVEKGVLGGTAVRTQVMLRLSREADAPAIHLLLYSRRRRAVPSRWPWA